MTFPANIFDINRPSLVSNVILGYLLTLLKLVLDDSHQLLFVQVGSLFDRILVDFDPDSVLRADHNRR